MDYIIKKSLPSNLLLIKDDLEQMINDLKNVLIDETMVFDVRLILDELICNGIKHGNRQDLDKLINIYIKVTERCIKIVVRDEGKGFKYNKEAYDPMKLTCDGRGLRIVDCLSDEFYILENKAISIKYF